MRNQLLRLLADNRRQFTPVTARIARADQADEATIYLYDPIVGDRATAEWWGGICPQDFVPALHQLDVSTIHLRINSPGGDVFAAQSMAQAMREHGARIVGHIDGLAASAATDIACACNEVLIASGGMYMIHQAWTLGWGNADELRATATLLDKVDTSMIEEYARFTGGDAQRITDWVKAETWFSAQEAVDAGFAHSIAQSAEKTTAQASAWNLRAYAKAPGALRQQRGGVQTPAPSNPSEPPAASADHRARQQQRMRLQALLAA